MKSSRIAALVGALAGGLLIVGCGGDEETTTSTALTQQQIIEQATPAVVRISGRTDESQQLLYGDTKFSGTGVVYKADDGATRILTNAHVIEGQTGLTAEFSDGTKSSLRVLGSAPCQDVAVLEMVNPPAEVATMSLGESGGVAVADPVIAMGFPSSVERSGTATVTSPQGTIVNADVQGTQVSPDLPTYPALIEHSATLNPGHSGGPLLDEQGLVVGLNTLASDTDQYYAISVDQVKSLLPTLEAGNDQVNLGWSLLAGDGATAQSITDETGLDWSGTVMVTGVSPNTPADDAVLASSGDPAAVTPGDGIFTINGTKVKNVPQVCKILQGFTPGTRSRSRRPT